MDVTYEFKDKKENRVIVSFTTAFPVTYCTISVVAKDRKVRHYHGGTVYNPYDRYNIRTGRFLAYKEALKRRFYGDVIHDKRFFVVWKDYHKAWSHFLSALMDGEVTSLDEYINQL